jgi:hypothetical protein
LLPTSNAHNRPPTDGGSRSSLTGVQARSGGSGGHVAFAGGEGGACIRQANKHAASAVISVLRDTARHLSEPGKKCRSPRSTLPLPGQPPGHTSRFRQRRGTANRLEVSQVLRVTLSPPNDTGVHWASLRRPVGPGQLSGGA